MPTADVQRYHTTVRAHHAVSPTAWEIVLERPDISFRAGELISLFGEDPLDVRDYTIASGENDPDLRVLYRLVEHGTLTPQLGTWEPGQTVEIAAPYGDFVLRDRERPILFVATGTGIAPCHSYIRSFPHLALTVLHGVRTAEDLFYRDAFASCTYLPCTSQEETAGFQGRVSERLADLPLPPETHVYLCGANEMIYEVTDILLKRGVASHCIFHEPYYYRSDD